jgi:Cof subfamily protein (haloacid dehalogenase superfamily)
MKTLFVSDLDGTLLSSDSRISPRSVDMLNDAISKGALFSVATARTPSTVASLLAEVNTDLPLIVMTGSAVWNRHTGEYSRIRTISPHSAGQIIKVIKEFQLPTFIYIIRDNIIDIYHFGPLSPEERIFVEERAHSPYKRFHLADDDPERVIGTDPSDVILFYSMHPSLEKERAYRRISEIRGCNPIFYYDLLSPDAGILEIFSDTASKANAVQWLKQHTGADRLVVFGDNLNDIPMMKVADLAVAVENAVPETKAVADLVIGPNTDDSVARFILENTSPKL